jgi:hypothetical protein
MNYKNGKWGKKIIELQHDDGSWGFFHTLSNPNPRQPMTTEQALRRLYVLGFSIDDKPIQKAVNYMHDCLASKINIPDREEKIHNWKVFTDLILSTWIQIFVPNDSLTNSISEKWVEIINCSFVYGKYDANIYRITYEKIFGIHPRGKRIMPFLTFYPISLVRNKLDKKIEPIYIKHILENDSGIYYIYDKKLSMLPRDFKTKNASRYIGAIELLAEYKNQECKEQLNFMVEWLKKNKNRENKWDMGKESKDGIYFPLSDSWKKEETRTMDCTYRINKLLEKI